MQPRISLVTLGVADLARAKAFYQALGWNLSGASQPEVAFFQANGLALALYGRSALAEEAGVDDAATGFAAISIAQNLRSEAEVDEVYASALAAGAKPLKSPRATTWGGYSGYFADPDGHLWEVAWNPFFPLDEAGNLHLPQQAEPLEALFNAANEARARAYARYSQFTVGAAVLSSDGRIYAGCNVENAAYPAGTCAEAGAIAAMIAAGESRIAAVLVTGDGPELVTPCGACRQRIREFASPETPIHIADLSGVRRSFRLDELLPFSFGPENLGAP